MSARSDLAAALRDLGSDDPTIRLRGAKALSSRARGNWTRQNKEWLTESRTIDALLAGLADTDKRVLRFVVNALGNICQRYDLHEPRVKDALRDRADMGHVQVQVTVDLRPAE